MNRRTRWSLPFSLTSFSLSAASIALALAVAPVACGGDDSDQASGSDGGVEASAIDAPSGDDTSVTIFDAGRDASQCLLFPSQTDPVGLCVQKAAIVGVHEELTEAGVPANWSVDTLAPATTDAGVIAHDVRDDVAYGASLAAYSASAAAYGDTEIASIVASDLQTIAHLVESELTTLPDDYDGMLYMRLRRFAAGLRAASFTSDADAIDALALGYGRAIYTSYFHVVTSGTEGADGGDDASDDGGATDAATNDASDSDGGAASDGILGVPSGGGFAYGADKAATGALALTDLAVRATNPADALAWSQAAGAIFHHLVSRARDASGLYFTQLRTSDDAAHDTVTDEGSLTSETQGAIALSYVRIAGLLLSTSASADGGVDGGASDGGASDAAASSVAIEAQAFADQTLAILSALQTTPALWDTVSTQATLVACNTPSVPLTSCGSGYMAAYDSTRTTLDTRKGTRANARLFAALRRSSLVSTLPEKNDLVPMYALFATRSGSRDSFFTQLPRQSAFIAELAESFTFTVFTDGGAIDGGPVDPLARYYSASATAEALEGLNDQWLGFPGAPTFFQ